MYRDIDSFIRYRIIDQVLKSEPAANLEKIKQAFTGMYPGALPGEEIIKKDILDMQTDESLGLFAPVQRNEKTGEYSYKDHIFSLDKVPLKEEEINLLRKSIRLIDLLKKHHSLGFAASVFQRISDLFQVIDLDTSLQSPDFVEMEDLPAFAGGQFLSPMIRAIHSKKVLRIYYHPFYEDKPYFILVHPYLIKEYKARWYLIALSDTKKEIRTFGLDRIWEMAETDDVYISRKFNAHDFFKNSVGVISPLGNPPDIQLKVSKHQAQYLITQPLHHSQYIEDENDDFVVFSYKVHPTYEFKSMILAMGKDVNVLKPESFRKEILHELNEAILNYGK